MYLICGQMLQRKQQQNLNINLSSIKYPYQPQLQIYVEMSTLIAVGMNRYI